MEDTRPFYQFLYKFVDLSIEEYQQYIGPYIQIRKFKKKQMITRHGEVENYFNFVLSGLARKFYITGEEEHTLQLATEGHIIHEQDSFHTRTPSESYIVALEPTALLSITFDDLERIYSTNSKMERLGRLVITFGMLQRDKRQLLMMKQSPRERFMHLVNNYSELLQRVPQKYLASYLNIQPETFSRFKHLVRERR
ncbi:MAG: Crp/Fnr family transcriptional regulator [Chitinophagaceae bacterium]